MKYRVPHSEPPAAFALVMGPPPVAGSQGEGYLGGIPGAPLGTTSGSARPRARWPSRSFASLRPRLTSMPSRACAGRDVAYCGRFLEWPAERDISARMSAPNVASCEPFSKVARKARHLGQRVPGGGCRVVGAGRWGRRCLVAGAAQRVPVAGAGRWGQRCLAAGAGQRGAGCWGRAAGRYSWWGQRAPRPLGIALVRLAFP